MSFIVDKQTLDDLNIFGRKNGKSIYGIFNRTQTRGGALLLEEMFRYPLSDYEKIKRRIEIIRYCKDNKLVFPFPNEWFDSIEYYLCNTDERTRINLEDNTLQRKLRSCMGADSLYDMLHRGIVSVIAVVNALHDFLERLDVSVCESFFTEGKELNEILRDPELDFVFREKGVKKLTYEKSAQYDQLLRYRFRPKLQRLLQLLYTLDVYTALAQVAEDCGFVLPNVLPAEKNILNIEEMFHPQLTHPVKNSLVVDHNSNFVFLTGANMAGKSTFMKTFGLCVFLAHAGFPVPATGMTFSVKNGMYTTINLPDNLSMGYSHFYAEVLRVKKVAEQVARTSNLVVIFDELFRGTNVQDAYEATVAIADAFAANRESMFLISTHIIEAGDALRKKCPNMNFVYLPTRMKDNKPIYTYRLEPGITADRHGMVIIRNEKIIEMLRAER